MKTTEEILELWAGQHQDAAAREGWYISDMYTTLQVQRIDNPGFLPAGIATHLPSDDVAMMMVCTGTGQHHAAARQIMHDHYPDEWARIEEATARVEDQMFPGRASK